MVTVKVYDEWEFRTLANGVVECRNEKLKLGWHERNADTIGMLADQLWAIGQAVMMVSAVFPREKQDIPLGAQPAIPAERDLSRVM